MKKNVFIKYWFTNNYGFAFEWVTRKKSMFIDRTKGGNRTDYLFSFKRVYNRDKKCYTYSFTSGKLSLRMMYKGGKSLLKGDR